jgi:ATP-dependent RNA helicase HrpB
MASMSISLPIDPFVPGIVDAARRRRAVVVTATPGAGKTTRVPPALAADGPVILLQPRRVAARAIARRIATEQGWTAGREVGWQVRFDRRFVPETRLLVATEGILTARLQQDPLASDFLTIVLDEFHERSIHADLGLALARQAWRARDDLRLVVMSATIDARRVAAYLDDCPVVEVPGRMHPLEIVYRPGLSPDRAVLDELPQTSGGLLCFLPGAGEIRRVAAALGGRLGPDVPLLPLHGGLDAEAQDAALTPTGGRRVILATNLAETTITVPDVTTVVDTGLQKVARYDAERAIDSLEVERVTGDSADQRAGRAGRTSAGRVARLWDSRDRLRPHREPEIARVDLASTALDVIAWGGDPRAIDWFDAPPAAALDAAMELLRRLAAVDPAGRITTLGRDLARLPIHPRLGRLLLAAGGAAEAARAVALLSERHFVPPRSGTTECDLLAAVDRDHALPPHVLAAARDIERLASGMTGARRSDRVDEVAFRRAVLSGYPDRVARRREPHGDRLVLASGTGAYLARESGVRAAEFLVAVDVTAGRAPGGEALVRLATGIDRAWLAPTSSGIRHEIDAEGRVRAWRVDRYDRLVLAEHPVPPDPEEAARLVGEAYLAREWPADVRLLARRLIFARIDVPIERLVHDASQGATRLADVKPVDYLSPADRLTLDRLAPLDLPVPSGRRVKLDYHDDGRVVAAVKLQELFGLADTPAIGSAGTPVTFELLAPNGRPVQVTSDLRSFWARGYPEVRKELRARYPRHPWPEDPWTARPTHRTTRRK